MSIITRNAFLFCFVFNSACLCNGVTPYSCTYPSTSVANRQILLPQNTEVAALKYQRMDKIRGQIFSQIYHKKWQKRGPKFLAVFSAQQRLDYMKNDTVRLTVPYTLAGAGNFFKKTIISASMISSVLRPNCSGRKHLATLDSTSAKCHGPHTQLSVAKFS
jgi:hypothetical protein